MIRATPSAGTDLDLVVVDIRDDDRGVRFDDTRLGHGVHALVVDPDGADRPKGCLGDALGSDERSEFGEALLAGLLRGDGCLVGVEISGFDAAAKEEEWVMLSKMGEKLRQLDPAFDPRTYGHKQLKSLIKDYRDNFVLKLDGTTLNVALASQANRD